MVDVFAASRTSFTLSTPPPSTKPGNSIESPFATVRLRERATRGAGSRSKGLLMAFKLLDMAEQRWRRLDGASLLPLIRAGVQFVDGVRPEQPKNASRPKRINQAKPPDHDRSIHNI